MSSYKFRYVLYVDLVSVVIRHFSCLKLVEFTSKQLIIVSVIKLLVR